MRVSEFDYDLPEDLIAQHPLPSRGDSLMLCLDGNSGALEDRRIRDLRDLLAPGDLLVLNDTRVIRARLIGTKSTGGRVQVLVERILDDHRVLAHVHANKAPKVGAGLSLQGELEAEILGRNRDLFELRFNHLEPIGELLERAGSVPLPPYIKRRPEHLDDERYQTVYARRAGAVAAPTAGLHFDEALLEALGRKGVEYAYVTLHVGAGTFQPVRSELVEDHDIHAEFVEVSSEACSRVGEAKAQGRRVIAVGTTSVRAVESAVLDGEIRPFRGDTRLFIYPGFQFRCVDALLTNFHLPQSSLLMLLCAFAGKANVLNAYAHAVRRRYRFFSYGDAMYVSRRTV